MIQYVGNVGIIAEISDYISGEKIVPCEGEECEFVEIKDLSTGVEYKECTKCKQQIILEIRV